MLKVGNQGAIDRVRQTGEVMGSWSMVTGMAVVVVYFRNMVASGWAILIKVSK